MSNSGLVMCEYCGFLISDDIAVKKDLHSGETLSICPDCYTEIEDDESACDCGYSLIADPFDFDVC